KLELVIAEPRFVGIAVVNSFEVLDFRSRDDIGGFGIPGEVCVQLNVERSLRAELIERALELRLHRQGLVGDAADEQDHQGRQAKDNIKQLDVERFSQRVFEDGQEFHDRRSVQVVNTWRAGDESPPSTADYGSTADF